MTLLLLSLLLLLDLSHVVFFVAHFHSGRRYGTCRTGPTLD